MRHKVLRYGNLTYDVEYLFSDFWQKLIQCTAISSGKTIPTAFSMSIGRIVERFEMVEIRSLKPPYWQSLLGFSGFTDHGTDWVGQDWDYLDTTNHIKTNDVYVFNLAWTLLLLLLLLFLFAWTFRRRTLQKIHHTEIKKRYRINISIRI